MNKQTKVLFVVACSALLLSACKKSDTSSTTLPPTNTPVTTQETTSEPTTEAFKKRPLIDAPTTHVDEEMMLRADKWRNTADLSRIVSAMRKADAGEPVTVSVIGGSITQGSSSTKQANAYASIMKDWWTKTFPQSEITFVNAGIGATNSYLGVHRLGTDILSHNPDFVIVEFSVNDANTATYKKSYDNLLRRLLLADNDIAVLSLFMTQEDGTRAQEMHNLVCFAYGVPMLSYGDVVLEEIKAGTYTWKDISPDNIHPNDKGHAITGEIIWHYLNSIYEDLDNLSGEVSEFTKKPVTREVYIDGAILDSKTLTPTQMGDWEAKKVYDRFPNNFTTSTGEESIIFEIETQNLGIMFYRTTNGTSGQFEVYVDGNLVTTLDANFKGGWGNYAETVEVYTSDKKATHTIEIKKAGNSTGDIFSILGLLVS